MGTRHSAPRTRSALGCDAGWLTAVRRLALCPDRFSFRCRSILTPRCAIRLPLQRVGHIQPPLPHRLVSAAAIIRCGLVRLQISRAAHTHAIARHSTRMAISQRLPYVIAAGAAGPSLLWQHHWSSHGQRAAADADRAALSLWPQFSDCARPRVDRRIGSVRIDLTVRRL